MSVWSFRGVASAIDPRRIVRSDVTFQRLRRRMVDDMGMDGARADRILDDMLARALTRFGDEFVLGKSKALDRVVQLRDRLDTLYHDALNFRGRSTPGGTQRVKADASVPDQVREINRLYDELDAALDELGRPVEALRPSSGATRSVAERTADEIDAIIAAARGRDGFGRMPGHEHRDIGLDITQGRLKRRGFVEVPGSDGKSFTRRFKTDGSTATFTMENGAYKVTVRDAAGLETTFREFDLLSTPYARRPFTTSLMQAHHGLQNSLMTDLFSDFGYDGGAAPTIWLRNSRKGSPHGTITASQNSERAARKAGLRTLAEIREVGIEDLARCDMPHDMITAYVRAFDEYFEAAVLPRIPADRRAALLGDWKAPSGAWP